MNRLELLIPPPLLMLVTGLVMWALAAMFPAPVLSWPQSIAVGGAIGMLGLLVSLAGMLSFRRANTTTDPRHPTATSTLVSSGIYRVSRNPMYLGVLIILIGWGIYLGNALSLLASLAFMPIITRYQIMPEERLLQEKFPTEFPAYMRSVRRWL